MNTNKGKEQIKAKREAEKFMFLVFSIRVHSREFVAGKVFGFTGLLTSLGAAREMVLRHALAALGVRNVWFLECLP